MIRCIKASTGHDICPVCQGGGQVADPDSYTLRACRKCDGMGEVESGVVTGQQQVTNKTKPQPKED